MDGDRVWIKFVTVKSSNQGEKKENCSSECSSSILLSIRIYGRKERSFMLPESKFPVTGNNKKRCSVVKKKGYSF